MSKPVSNKLKIILPVLCLALLCGICAAAYFKIAKDNFDTAEYINVIPDSDTEKIEYVKELYNSAFTENSNVLYSSNIGLYAVGEGESNLPEEIDGIILSLQEKLKKKYETLIFAGNGTDARYNDFLITDNSFNVRNNSYIKLTNGKTDDSGKSERENICFVDFYCGSDDSSIYGLEEVKKTFNTDTDEESIYGLKDELSDICEIRINNCGMANCKIDGEINRKNDKLGKISFSRIYFFDVSLNFIDGYSKLGTTDALIKIEIADKYDFD